MRAWLVRAGRHGELEHRNLQDGVVGPSFRDQGDLSGAVTPSDVRAIVAATLPGAPAGRISNYGGQLSAFRLGMDVGDLVVMPLRTTGQLAIGRVTGQYEYRAADEAGRRHVRTVEWLRTDVARTAVHQDLLYSLGAFMTVCELVRNDAAWRIDRMATTGIDPGARAEAEIDESESIGSMGSIDDANRSDSTPLDVERFARDRLAQLIAERFAGHPLAQLVAAILEAEGYTCDVSPRGPDGGVDILAARGPLGLDSPHIVVQVKSGPHPVDAPGLQQLHGALATHGGDQGLMVAWGGITSAARRALGTQRFTVRVWTADDLIDNLCRVYERLPEDLKSDLPLKLIWVPVEEAPV